jgi:hypothetical protein
MPKKDVSSAVLGMLSTAGSQTRRPTTVADEPPQPPRSEAAVSDQPATIEESHRPVTQLPPVRPEGANEAAPRTLRLRADTASRLREAWLQAKRDDVLLTAQDFASNLVEDALARRRRRAASSS